MKVVATAIAGVVRVEPDVHRDARGEVLEVFHADRYAAAGIAIGAGFVQENLSWSQRGVVRGLHYQLARPQGKLVHVLRGAIFDVAVDLRRGSATFGRWCGAELSADDHHQLWIPPGCAHGFQALGDGALVAYQLTQPYTPSDERALRWNDPALAITWPLAAAALLSPRDADAPLLAAAELPP